MPWSCVGAPESACWRIGFVQAPADEPVAAGVRQYLAGLAEALDWTLVEVADDELRAALDRPYDGHLVLITDFYHDMSRYLASNPQTGLASFAELAADSRLHDEIKPSVQASLALGTADQAAYRAELEQRAVVADALDALLDRHGLEALAYPTIRRVAQPLGQPQPGTNCRIAANSGFPAVSVPAGFDADGLPYALELLGRRFAEQTLLDLAWSAESTAPRRRAPALSGAK